jgi:hypothetical protein
MTQLPKRFELEVWSRLGATRIITYTSESPGGIVGGFVSRRYANGTCGGMDFEAKPSLTRIEAGSILYTRMDTGAGVVKTHFGVVTSNPDGRSGERGTYQVASGKELLKRSIVPVTFDTDFDEPVDAAIWMRNLVSRFRHPALKYDAGRIALTGVMFAPTLRAARGRNLYEALEAILSAVPTISENDWGVDPEGYVVIRPPTGEINRLKSSVITQFGDITSDAVVTQATILVANEPSEGAIASPGYAPAAVGYTYTHPEHTEWRAARSFEIETRDNRPVIDVLEPNSSGASYGGLEFLPTGTDFSTALEDDDLATYARPAGTNTGFYIELVELPDTPPIAVEMVLEFLTGAAYTAILTFIYSFSSGSSDPNAKLSQVKVKFDLKDLVGQGIVQNRVVVPPMFFHRGLPLRDITADFTVTSSTALQNYIKIYEFKFLSLNTTLLEQIARNQIRLPAKEVQEVTFARGFNDEGQAYGAYLLETPAKTLRLLGEKGEDIGLSGNIAEIVDTFTVTEGMLSRVALGQPIRDPVVRAIQKMIR